MQKPAVLYHTCPLHCPPTKSNETIKQRSVRGWRDGLRAAALQIMETSLLLHINRNLPAVTREAPRQLRTSRKNLSIFQTLGRRAVPCTLAGGAVLCCSAFTSVHAYSLDWKRDGDCPSEALQHLGQRSLSSSISSSARRTGQPPESGRSASLLTAVEPSALHMRRRFSKCAPKTLPDLLLLLLLLLEMVVVVVVLMLEVVLSAARLLQTE